MSREKQIEEMAKMMVDSNNKEVASALSLLFVRLSEALYNAGYRKQEWISVDERLPEDENERVLVFLQNTLFTAPIGKNKIDTDRYVDKKWVRWSEYVTHWMPLPEAPKMKGGAE